MMTRDELRESEKALRQFMEGKIRELRKSYAEVNRKYEIGDIIEDHYHIIKVTHLDYYLNSDNPQVRYKGTQLNKDLTPSKRQADTDMFQENIIKKHEQ